jgi:catechol-2,3-dioxygenase
VDILETCLYAEDLGAVRGFYEGILGLECTNYREGEFAFFRSSRSMLLVFNPAYSLGLQKLPPHGAKGSVHVAFRVCAKDLVTIRERFQSLGYLIQDAVWGNGQSSFYVCDPAGNPVEFAPPGIWGIPE